MSMGVRWLIILIILWNLEPNLKTLIWQRDRLNKVLEFVSNVHDICAVLGMDFYSSVTEVHPSLNDATSVQSKSISNDTLARLGKTVLALKDDKSQRLKKVHCFARFCFLQEKLIDIVYFTHLKTFKFYIC